MKQKEINITHQDSIRAKLLVWLFEYSKPIYKSLMKRNKSAWKITLSQLLALPTKSLGKELGLFLQENEFSLEEKFESHDVCHILFQYNTDVVSEIGLQALLLGNGKKSIYALGTVIIGFALFPEQFEYIKRQFQKGKTMMPFTEWNFEHLLKENINELRSHIYRLNTEKTLYI